MAWKSRELSIRSTNPEGGSVRVCRDGVFREVGIIAGDRAIWVREEDLDELIEALEEIRR